MKRNFYYKLALFLTITINIKLNAQQFCSTIYAVNDANPSVLTSINPLSGVVTNITTLGTNTRAIAKDPVTGRIYFGSQTTPFNTGYYDPTTGLVTTLGFAGTGLDFTSFAFSSNGNLYGFQDNSNVLYSIDKYTGTTTALATLSGILVNSSNSDIAFLNGSNDVMLGVFRNGTQSRLYSITVSGTPSSAFLGNVGSDLRGIAFTENSNLVGYTNNQFTYLDSRNGGTVSIYAAIAGYNVTDMATNPVPFNKSSISLSSFPASCNNISGISNSDASIVLSGFGLYDKYDISTGSTYLGTSNYSSALSIPANGVLQSALSNTANIRTVRVFGEEGCTVDLTVSQIVTDCANNCGTPGKDGVAPSTVQPVFSYQAITLSVTGNVLSLTGLGTPPLTVGDKLLFIQMQGADITSSDGVNYGTPSNISAGNFEFGVITAINGTGPFSITLKKPLTNTYINSPNTGSASQGNKSFQIIRVPQFSSMTLPAGGINVSAWNGTTGGVLVLDVQGNLDFNGQTINAKGAGFRGGAGRQLNSAGSNTAYVALSSANRNGSKGEGVAGTPRYLNAPTGLLDNLVEGYPNGSYARGPAANAGGGGTDGSAGGNSENSGGGGGANAGAGGNGGWGWDGANVFEQTGGLGGISFESSPTKIVMGGGGGAGSSNNGTGTYKGTGSGFASSGHSGGGIVIISASSFSNVGTIDVSGNSWENTSLAGDVLVANDAGGGGGGGGSVLLFVTNSAGLSNITVDARGGNGASLTASIHGPGGGGGGGVIYANGTLNSNSSVVNGTNGLSFPTGNFGSSIGTKGVLPPTGTSTSGISFGSGTSCQPPSLTQDIFTLNELGTVSGNLFTNDINPITGTFTGITLTGISQPIGLGRIIVNSLTGSFTFISTLTGVSTTTSLIYTACNINGCSTAQIAISITNPSDCRYVGVTYNDIGGGSLTPGNTIQLRVNLSVGSPNTLFGTSLVQEIPTGFTYIPNTLRIINGDGTTFATFTDANDGDNGQVVGNIARINIGSGANSSNGGNVIGGTTPPVFGASIITLSINVSVTGALNSIVTSTGYGIYSLSPIGSILTCTGGSPLNIQITSPSTLCSDFYGVNYFDAYNFGTFGSGVGQNLGSITGTNYSYVPLDCVNPVDGFYSIVNSTDCNGSGTAGGGVFDDGWWSRFGDHTNASDQFVGNAAPTTGSIAGYMFVVNASYTPDIVVTDVVTGLCPNMNYEYTAWLKNACQSCGGAPNSSIPGVLPNLAFSIDNVDLYSSGDLPYTNTWRQLGFLYQTKANQTSATVKIRNNAPGGGGNDWALDDVAFRSCLPTINYTISNSITAGNNVSVCGAQNIDFVATVTSKYSNYNNFKWQISSTTGSSWNDLSGAQFVPTTLIGGNYTYITSLLGVPFNVANNGNLIAVSVATSLDNLTTSSCNFRSNALTVSVTSLPNITLTSSIGPVTTTVCNRPSGLTVTASGGNTYAWSTSATTPDIAIAASTINGIYTVTASGIFNCKATRTFTVLGMGLNPCNTPPTVAGASVTIPVNQGIRTIPGLSAGDMDGTISYFTITTLPSAGFGTLYYCTPGCTAITTTGTTLTGTQANSLSFLPTGTITGIVNFNFSVTDNGGATSTSSGTYAISLTGTPLIADIGTTITGTASVNAGSLIIYTISGRNNGPSTSSGTSFNTTLPAGLIVNVCCSGAYNSITGIVTFPSVTIQPNSTVGFTFTVTAPANLISISPTVTGLSGLTDTVSGNNTSSTTTTINPSADISTTITGPASANAGTAIVYTITGKNNGPSSVSGISFNTTLPSGLTVNVCCSGSYNSASGIITFSGTSLQVNSIVGYTFTVTAPANLSTLTPSVTGLSTVIDVNLTNNLSSISTTIIPSSDISTSITGPNAVVAGSQIVFTVNGINNGVSTATSVVFTTTLPSSLSGVVVNNGGSYNSITGVVTFPTIAILTPSNLQTYNITVPAVGTLSVMSATTSGVGSEFDPILTNNTRSINVSIGASTDLVINVTSITITTVTGNAIFTITGTNNGPSNGANTIVTATLPSGLTGVIVSNGGSYNSGTGVVTFPTITSLTVGSSTPSYTVTVPTVATMNTLTLTGNISSSTLESVPGNNTASSTVTVVPAANVVVTVTGPTTITAGSPIIYTMTGINNGPSTAVGVAFTTTLPSGLIVNPCCGGSYNSVTGVVTFPSVTMPNGGTQIYTFTVTAPPTLTNINPTVSGFSPTTLDTTPGNNTATLPGGTTIIPSSDISTSIIGPNAVTAGGSIVFTVNGINNGVSTATSVVFTTTLPSGLSDVLVSGGGTYNSITGVVTFPTIATLTPSNLQTYNISVPAVGTLSVMSATTSGVGSEFDADLSNNTSAINVLIGNVADISVSVSGLGTVSPNNEVSYTFSYQNVGPSVASVVGFTATIPSGFTLTTVSGGGVYDAITGVITFPTISGILPNSSVTGYVVSLIAPASLTGISVSFSGTTTTNEASLTNNIAFLQTIIAPLSDVVISVTGPSTVTAGSPIVYTVTSTNNGPSTATGIAVTVTLPGGLNVINDCGGTYNSITGILTLSTITSLAPNASQICNITVIAPSDITTIRPTVSGVTDTNDTLPGNNTNVIPVTTTVINPASDLIVVISGPSTITAFTPINYTVNVTNTGISSATGVSVNVTIPSGLSNVSVCCDGSYNSVTGVISYPNTTLGTGETSIYTFTISPERSFTGIINASTSGNSTSLDTNLGNNLSGISTNVVPTADLVVSVTGPSNVLKGNPVIFTVTGVNNGPSTANDVIITVTLPGGLENVGVGCNGTYNSVTGVVTFPPVSTMVDTQTSICNITVPATGNLTSITPTVSGTSATLDPIESNNNNVVSPVIIGESANVAVSVSGPSMANSGDKLTYSITVSNNGPSTSENVNVTVTIPSGLTNVEVCCGGSYSASTGVITYPVITNLNVNANQTYTFSINAPSENTTWVVSASGVSATTFDSNRNDNISSTPTIITLVEDNQFIPGGFSPNGDAENETLVIRKPSKAKTTTLAVFNRWGNEIYQSDDYQNDWAGTASKGAISSRTDGVPDGTYFLVVTFLDVNGNVIGDKIYKSITITR